VQQRYNFFGCYLNAGVGSTAGVTSYDFGEVDATVEGVDKCATECALAGYEYFGLLCKAQFTTESTGTSASHRRRDAYAPSKKQCRCSSTVSLAASYKKGTGEEWCADSSQGTLDAGTTLWDECKDTTTWGDIGIYLTGKSVSGGGTPKNYVGFYSTNVVPKNRCPAEFPWAYRPKDNFDRCCRSPNGIHMSIIRQYYPLNTVLGHTAHEGYSRSDANYYSIPYVFHGRRRANPRDEPYYLTPYMANDPYYFGCNTLFPRDLRCDICEAPNDMDEYRAGQDGYAAENPTFSVPCPGGRPCFDYDADYDTTISVLPPVTPKVLGLFPVQGQSLAAAYDKYPTTTTTPVESPGLASDYPGYRTSDAHWDEENVVTLIAEGMSCSTTRRHDVGTLPQEGKSSVWGFTLDSFEDCVEAVRKSEICMKRDMDATAPLFWYKKGGHCVCMTSVSQSACRSMGTETCLSFERETCRTTLTVADTGSSIYTFKAAHYKIGQLSYGKEFTAGCMIALTPESDGSADSCGAAAYRHGNCANYFQHQYYKATSGTNAGSGVFSCACLAYASVGSWAPADSRLGTSCETTWLDAQGSSTIYQIQAPGAAIETPPPKQYLYVQVLDDATVLSSAGGYGNRGTSSLKANKDGINLEFKVSELLTGQRVMPCELQNTTGFMKGVASSDVCQAMATQQSTSMYTWGGKVTSTSYPQGCFVKTRAVVPAYLKGATGSPSYPGQSVKITTEADCTAAAAAFSGVTYGGKCSAVYSSGCTGRPNGCIILSSSPNVAVLNENQIPGSTQYTDYTLLGKNMQTEGDLLASPRAIYWNNQIGTTVGAQNSKYQSAINAETWYNKAVVEGASPVCQYSEYAFESNNACPQAYDEDYMTKDQCRLATKYMFPGRTTTVSTTNIFPTSPIDSIDYVGASSVNFIENLNEYFPPGCMKIYNSDGSVNGVHWNPEKTSTTTTSTVYAWEANAYTPPAPPPPLGYEVASVCTVPRGFTPYLPQSTTAPCSVTVPCSGYCTGGTTVEYSSVASAQDCADLCEKYPQTGGAPCVSISYISATMKCYTYADHCRIGNSALTWNSNPGASTYNRITPVKGGYAAVAGTCPVSKSLDGVNEISTNDPQVCANLCGSNELGWINDYNLAGTLGIRRRRVSDTSHRYNECKGFLYKFKDATQQGVCQLLSEICANTVPSVDTTLFSEVIYKKLAIDYSDDNSSRVENPQAYVMVYNEGHENQTQTLNGCPAGTSEVVNLSMCEMMGGKWSVEYPDRINYNLAQGGLTISYGSHTPPPTSANTKGRAQEGHPSPANGSCIVKRKSVPADMCDEGTFVDNSGLTPSCSADCRVRIDRAERSISELTCKSFCERQTGNLKCLYQYHAALTSGDACNYAASNYGYVSQDCVNPAGFTYDDVDASVCQCTKSCTTDADCGNGFECVSTLGVNNACRAKVDTQTYGASNSNLCAHTSTVSGTEVSLVRTQFKQFIGWLEPTVSASIPGQSGCTASYMDTERNQIYETGCTSTHPVGVGENLYTDPNTGNRQAGVYSTYNNLIDATVQKGDANDLSFLERACTEASARDPQCSLDFFVEIVERPGSAGTRYAAKQTNGTGYTTLMANCYCLKKGQTCVESTAPTTRTEGNEVVRILEARRYRLASQTSMATYSWVTQAQPIDINQYFGLVCVTNHYSAAPICPIKPELPIIAEKSDQADVYAECCDVAGAWVTTAMTPYVTKVCQKWCCGGNLLCSSLDVQEADAKDIPCTMRLSMLGESTTWGYMDKAFYTDPYYLSASSSSQVEQRSMSNACPSHTTSLISQTECKVAAYKINQTWHGYTPRGCFVDETHAYDHVAGVSASKVYVYHKPFFTGPMLPNVRRVCRTGDYMYADTQTMYCPQGAIPIKDSNQCSTLAYAMGTPFDGEWQDRMPGTPSFASGNGPMGCWAIPKKMLDTDTHQYIFFGQADDRHYYRVCTSSGVHYLADTSSEYHTCSTSGFITSEATCQQAAVSNAWTWTTYTPNLPAGCSQTVKAGWNYKYMVDSSKDNRDFSTFNPGTTGSGASVVHAPLCMKGLRRAQSSETDAHWTNQFYFEYNRDGSLGMFARRPSPANALEERVYLTSCGFNSRQKLNARKKLRCWMEHQKRATSTD
jgi:hypothetical protein